MDEETQRVMREMLSVARATAGPLNTRHLLVRSMGSVRATSSSRFYMEQTVLQHPHNPLVRIFLQILNTHHKTQGDAGWFCIAMATHLMTAGCKLDISTSSLIEGVNLACRVAVEELTSMSSLLSLPLDWGEPKHVISVLMTMFRPHMRTVDLSEEAMTFLASTLLAAFIGSLSDGSNGTLSSYLVFYSSSSMTLSDRRCCQHLEGSLILDIPLPRAFPPNGARDILVAVFEESLEMPEQLGNVNIENNMTLSENEEITAKNLEYLYMDKMCDIFSLSGVGVVCCQRRIHPYLQRIMSLKGIVCIPRLSIRYINAVLQLSGAKQLGAFPQIQMINSLSKSDTPLNISSLGYLHRIHLKYIGDKQILIMKQSRVYGKDDDDDNNIYDDVDEITDEEAVVTMLVKEKSLAFDLLQRRMKISTMLLVGFHDGHCHEIEYMCQSAIKVLTQLINGSRATVLPGGGCWQAVIAHHIRCKLKSGSIVKPTTYTSSSTDDFDISDILDCNLGTSVSPETEIRKSIKLFCDGLECFALTVGSCDNTVEDWDRIWHQNSSGGVFRWKGFTWSTRQSSLDEYTLLPCSFRSPNGCEVDISMIDSGSDTSVNLENCDAIDALLPCVNALNVATEAFTSVIDIDGIIVDSTTAK